MSVNGEITDQGEAPEGYDIGETDGQTKMYSCPHHGCDGMVFYTTEECKRHEEDWHNGPYICTCKDVFAARPALQRHIRAAWHREYNRKPETFSCVEECCPKYEEPLSTLYNLRNHNQSAVHRAAENKRAYFESIRTVIGRAIHERMEAFQPLICDVPNCPDFQKQWSTAASFVKHADTEMHQSYDKAFEEALTSGPEKLAKLERESRPFECHRKRCEGHGQRFRTKTEYHGHCSSTSHTEATTDVPPRRPQTPKLVR
ncbi:hypothetical protein NLU13_1552 [Sarocladium strictum]|uniref:Uncharacterized protein n=1 Tax=Sarocladium strictum TaxID=5046 RepID=A0AA39GRY8_SARSR|nr:hypothetical protein NLU13_1552 [Sarocladium strictum]